MFAYPNKAARPHVKMIYLILGLMPKVEQALKENGKGLHLDLD